MCQVAFSKQSALRWVGGFENQGPGALRWGNSRLDQNMSTLAAGLTRLSSLMVLDCFTARTRKTQESISGASHLSSCDCSTCSQTWRVHVIPPHGLRSTSVSVLSSHRHGISSLSPWTQHRPPQRWLTVLWGPRKRWVSCNQHSYTLPMDPHTFSEGNWVPQAYINSLHAITFWEGMWIHRV